MDPNVILLLTFVLLFFAVVFGVIYYGIARQYKVTKERKRVRNQEQEEIDRQYERALFDVEMAIPRLVTGTIDGDGLWALHYAVEAFPELSETVWPAALQAVAITNGRTDIRQFALSIGRAYHRHMRNGPVTLYDETAIANDINSRIRT